MTRNRNQFNPLVGGTPVLTPERRMFKELYSVANSHDQLLHLIATILVQNEETLKKTPALADLIALVHSIEKESPIS